MKRILHLLALVFLPVLAFGQGGNIGGQSSPVERNIGQLLPGVSISICQPLATTAASVTSNLAVLTMSSNPITAGFAAGMQIQVAGFTGGDTIFNGGTFTSGTGITSGFTISSVTATTITFPLTHANATASSNGTVLQMGNTTTGCGGLSTITSDPALATPLTQPITSDAFGNWNAYATPGLYYVQFYGSGVTTTLRQYAIACVPASSVSVCAAGISGGVANNLLKAGGVTSGTDSGIAVSNVTLLNGNNALTGNETHSGTEGFTNTNTTTNAGVFTDTQMNLYLQSLINSINLTTEYQAAQGSHGNTAAIAGGVLSGAGSTVELTSGLSGFVQNSSTTTAAVGLYGQGRCLLNSTRCWGSNVVAIDTSGLTTNVQLIGFEADTDPLSATGAYANVFGVNSVLGGGSGPSGSYGAAFTANSTAPQKWLQGYATGNNQVITAFSAGALCNSGTCNSQPLSFNSLNAGSNVNGGISLTNAGNLSITLPGAGQITSAAPINISNNSTGNSALFTQANASGFGVVITPGVDTNYALQITNAANNANRHQFYGNGNASLSIGGGDVTFGGGVLPDGAGFKHKRFGGTCTTGNAAGNTCTTTLSWSTAFADANYTPVCWGEGPTGTPILALNATQVAASVTVIVTTATAVASSFAAVYCIATHD